MNNQEVYNNGSNSNLNVNLNAHQRASRRGPMNQRSGDNDSPHQMDLRNIA
jgi:hypothetical protein